MLKTLLKCVPEHHCYVEVFAGGAKLYFAKEPAPVEVLNDTDAGLVNFYKVIRDHYVDFQNRWRLLLHSSIWFKEFLAMDPAKLNSTDQACRFWYLLNGSFASLGRTFGRSKKRNPATHIATTFQKAEMMHERLAITTIEQVDFQEVIERYDFEDAFFYLDPPYLNKSKDMYQEIMVEADFVRLKNCLAGVKGRFLMSHGADNFIKDLFSEFQIREVETTYLMTGGLNKEAINKTRSEYLISNYELTGLDE